jgi:putative FmdB family regulatory protein
MATYAFECSTCGERFEVNMPMHEHDDPARQHPACPKCGKPDTQQRITTFVSKPASISF